MGRIRCAWRHAHTPIISTLKLEQVDVMDAMDLMDLMDLGVVESNWSPVDDGMGMVMMKMWDV